MSNQKTNEETLRQELRQRVIYALLSPAVRLAQVFGVGLKDLRGLLDTAYFQQLRNSDLTHQDIAKALGVSERTAVKLSRQAREQFLEASRQHNLPRRIEFMLGAEPMGLGRIGQLLPDTDAIHVANAVQELLRQKRIIEVQGRTLKYAPSAAVRSLPRDTLMARVGGLNSLAENLTNAVYGRFFKEEPRTFARTLTFRGGPEIYEQRASFDQEVILPGFRDIHRPEGELSLEERQELEAAQISLCWAPYEYIDPNQEKMLNEGE